MVTMLDVIKRAPLRYGEIIEKRKGLFTEVTDYVKNNEVSQIIFVGSGSSYSACLSSMWFVEKASGLPTSVMLPNVFINKSAFDKKALYVFVSQSGSSTQVTNCAKLVNSLGCESVCVSANKVSHLGNEAKLFASIEVGYEEYTYATLGFSTTIFTLLMMGMEMGLERGYLTQDEYDAYVSEIAKLPASVTKVIEDAQVWINNRKDEFIACQNFVYYGGNNLWGIATEGALKMMEISKEYLSQGWELDDGMHGPNYCLDKRTVVFALNDGKDDKNCHDLMRLMKNEYGTGYMIGVNPMDEKDFVIDYQTSNFTNLETIPVLQVLAYMTAGFVGTDIFRRDDPRINTTKGKGYFRMHNDAPAAPKE